MILTELLKEKNMNMLTLSKASGVPYSTLRELASGESDYRNSSVQNFIKLAKALDVTVEELYIIFENTRISQMLSNQQYITDDYRIPFVWNHKKGRLDFKYDNKEHHLPLPQLKMLMEDRMNIYIQAAIWKIDDFVSEAMFLERVKEYG